jgi:hypothetical protein
MLPVLRSRASERKLRLFALESGLSEPGVLSIASVRRIGDAVSAFVDGGLPLSRVREVRSRWDNVVRDLADFATGGSRQPEIAGFNTLTRSQAERLLQAIRLVRWAATEPITVRLIQDFPASEVASADLLRDIFGNPFRPVSVDPAWLTSTVVQLAQGIYEDRAFDRLPILADAMQDAGCENPDVLAHCRRPGPHVRGCWVVDLVLGKS